MIRIPFHLQKGIRKKVKNPEQSKNKIIIVKNPPPPPPKKKSVQTKKKKNRMQSINEVFYFSIGNIDESPENFPPFFPYFRFAQILHCRFNSAPCIIVSVMVLVLTSIKRLNEENYLPRRLLHMQTRFEFKIFQNYNNSYFIVS
jgi:hypothetical protein